MKKTFVPAIAFMIVFVCTVCSTLIFACADEPVPPAIDDTGLELFIADEENNTITYVLAQDIDDENVKVYRKFYDVSMYDECVKQISHMVQLGVMNGISEHTFAPDACISKAQFISMLAVMSKDDMKSYEGKSVFSDVAEDAWYAPQVEWARREGLINGKKGSSLGPDNAVTREEAAVMMYRYIENSGSKELKQYKRNLKKQNGEGFYVSPEDEKDISEWADYEVHYIYAAGLMHGSGYCFQPKEYITRRECAKVFSDFIMADNKPKIIFVDGNELEYLGEEENILMSAFARFMSFEGSLVCILICIVITLISRRCFSKTFSGKFWKCSVPAVIGAYLLFLLWMIITLKNDPAVAEGTESSGMFFFKVQLNYIGPVVGLFTVCYIVSFVIRLIAKRRDARKAEEKS